MIVKKSHTKRLVCLFFLVESVDDDMYKGYLSEKELSCHVFRVNVIIHLCFVVRNSSGILCVMVEAE
jgi:hypothetical protein